MRGEGRIFERKGSSALWCAYYVHGREIRESTGTADPEKAAKFLKRRLREVDNDRDGTKAFVGPRSERIRVSCGVMDESERKADCDCLCCALERDYRLRGKDSPQNVSNIKRVRQDFALQRAMNLRADQVDHYIERRVSEGAAPATVNRVTQLLGQAYNLAIKQNRIAAAPFIRHLSEAGNVRQGFFSVSEYDAVESSLPGYLKDIARFCYITGWRRREAATLTWEDVDDNMIRLRAENAKIRVARSVPIDDELAALIERRRSTRQVEKPDHSIVLSHLIFHRDGKAIGDFRKAWHTACVMAGLGKLYCRNCKNVELEAGRKCPKCAQKWTDNREPEYRGKLFHDFRRTAARNMVRGGVPEGHAMSITGHKTRSMFDRYNIHDDRDQLEALKAARSYREQQAAALREKVSPIRQQSTGVQ
jgi:integrase